MIQAVAQVDARRTPPEQSLPIDIWLVCAVAALVSLGLVMVASASISIAARQDGGGFYFFWRQLGAIGLGAAIGFVMIRTPLAVLQRMSTLCLLAAFLLLVAVLVPGLGREVNGSMRWVRFGPLTMQASEPVKLAIVIYVAGYLVRHTDQVKREFIGFIKPIGVLTLVAGLLLLEPDFGAAVVLFSTTLGMVFMGGVPLARFFSWGLAALAALASLAILAPYRMKRLMTFMDPWSDPYNTGFQLTQALIAFGRGEWFGVGLGNSVQKLFYLPEVHTDFIFAVIGEEFGLVGTWSVIALFLFLVWRIFHVAALAERAGQAFAAYIAYGVGLLIGIEAFVNIGVNMGILPTKGLTLPLISYGSNSIVMICVAISLVMRVAFEARAARPNMPAAVTAAAVPAAAAAEAQP